MSNPEQRNAIDPELLKEMRLAYSTISQRDSPLLRTETIRNEWLSQRFGQGTTIVSELHQPGKSFKLRGAYNYFKNLTRAQLDKDVVSASAGNHAQGVARCSKLFKTKSHIFVPKSTPPNKIALIEEIGGPNVKMHRDGDDFDESLKLAQSFCEEKGSSFSAPFDDLKVIAGQATLGMEIYQDISNIGAVFVPVGGGGLIAGVAAALKNRDPSIRVIGVEPELAGSLQYARKLGIPSALQGEFSTFVDGAAVRQVGALPFEYANDLIDDVMSVSDIQVREVVTELWGVEESWSWLVKTELAGALSLTGLRHYGLSLDSNRVSVGIITGGNLSEERFEEEVRI
jgi:threonine dehydratase